MLRSNASSTAAGSCPTEAAFSWSDCSRMLADMELPEDLVDYVVVY
jgi:hypothetical protein